MAAVDTAAAHDPLLRIRVEDFLFHEAALLDGWRLDDWLALFTDDARYVVPAMDRPADDPSSSLTLIDDNADRLAGRVTRLKSRRAHREFPWSVTRRLVGNVQVSDAEPDGLRAQANFVVHRFRKEEIHTFVGRYEYRLAQDDGGFKIRAKTAYLDNERLSPHGSLSILL